MIIPLQVFLVKKGRVFNPSEFAQYFVPRMWDSKRKANPKPVYAFWTSSLKACKNLNFEDSHEIYSLSEVTSAPENQLFFSEWSIDPKGTSDRSANAVIFAVAPSAKILTATSLCDVAKYDMCDSQSFYDSPSIVTKRLHWELCARTYDAVRFRELPYNFWFDDEFDLHTTGTDPESNVYKNLIVECESTAWFNTTMLIRLGEVKLVDVSDDKIEYGKLLDFGTFQRPRRNSTG